MLFINKILFMAFFFFLANSILNNKFSIGILLKKLVGDLVLINEILMFFSNWGKYRDANANYLF